jgi:hypothetical protein
MVQSLSLRRFCDTLKAWMWTSNFASQRLNMAYKEADIRWAIDTIKYDGYLEDDEDIENKRLLIGFDRNANPLEIYYNILDTNTVRIFHAMVCRNIHKHLLKDEE